MNKYLKQFFSHKRRTLFGTNIEQSTAAIYVLEQFLSSIQPDIIMELGTGRGSLSTYFKCYTELSKDNPKFKTFDIVDRHSLNIINYFRNKDVYNHDVIVDNCIELNDKLKPFIYIDALDPKSTLINLYSPHLNSGTIIAGHDFITNPNKSFRWGFNESDIDWKHVEPFEPYYTMSKELDTRTIYLEVK